MIKKHIGLFEGIGGFSLAARWMGWETIAWSEWNEFGQKVLKHHFPKATGHGDITKTDFTIYRGQCDILTGGFPCQPYSQAGKRLGKEDERHLWPSMLRAIREIQPTYVVGENVSGLINWNGGMVFDEVQTDLEAEGYEVLPFVLPACGVNAPHRRDRVWFIAYSDNARANRRSGIDSKRQEENKGWQGQPQLKHRKDGRNGITKNPDNIRWTGNEWQEEPNKREQREFSTGNNERIQTNDGEIGITPNTNNNGLQQYIYRGEQSQLLGKQKEERTNRNTIIIKPIEAVGSRRITSNTECSRGGEVHNNMETGEPNGHSTYAINEQNTWHNFPTQPPLCGGNDGLSDLSHIDTIQKENTMDRTLVIKSAIEAGRLIADIETGKIYSTVTKLNKGENIELPGADCNGYRVHNISFGGVKKQCRAHQIVWIYANGVYDKDSLMIDHIDRNRSNNKLSNLRLVDAKGNMENKTPYEGKLTQEQKDDMYLLYTKGDHSMRELAEDFGISKSRVHQLISEHGGFDGITFPKWRTESIKAYGNAIVPQVAFQIFKAIEEINNKI